MAINHGSVGRVLAITGTSTAFSQQAAAHVTGSGYTRYQVGATYRYMDPLAAPTVEKSTNGGTTWNAVTAGFSIEYAGGIVVFDAALGASDLVRVSGKYYTPVEWGQLLNWKMDVGADMVDITTFSSGGVKQFLPGLKEINGSVEGFWADGTQLATITAGSLVVLVLYVDYGTAKKRYEGYGYLKKNAPEVAVDDAVKESSDFVLLRAYYREG